MKKRICSLLTALVMVAAMLPLGVTAAHAEGVLYTVTVQTVGSGTVSVDPVNAAEDDYVTVTMTAADGWFIKEMLVKAGEDTQISRINYTSAGFEQDIDGFTMPDSNVTLTVTFAKPEDFGDDTTPYTTGEACVVSFDSNGGEGVMADIEAETGDNYTLPVCTFTKADREFYKWEMDGILYDDGVVVTLTGDTVLKAIWKYAGDNSYHINNSVDVSSTRVVGILKMHDLRTGETSEYTECDMPSISSFADPYTASIHSMTETAQAMLHDGLQRFRDAQQTALTVGDPEILESRDDRTYTYFDGDDLIYTDANGDYYSSVLLEDGIYGRQWQITVTLEAECTSLPSSYLHVLSTRDGGWVDFWCEDYYGDYTQPYAVPEGAEVTLSAVPASGYVFKGWYRGDVNASSYDEMFTDELITTENPYVFNATGYPYICAKFEYTGVERQGEQVQMWITDGGTASVTYTPTWNDSAYIKPKDGSNYLPIGEVIALWKGDAITVNAKPDNGYVFKGWYHVRIEWGPGDTLPKYEGDVIATESSFTYQPGVTVVAGDTEPLRYICAVFERADGVLLGDANGDGKVTISDVTVIQRYTAQLEQLTGDCLAAADVNGDGVVNVSDATFIQQYLAEFAVSYPIGT